MTLEFADERRASPAASCHNLAMVMSELPPLARVAWGNSRPDARLCAWCLGGATLS